MEKREITIKLPENYVDVAWEWFKSKYGLLFRSNIKKKNNYYIINLGLGSLSYSINFSVSNLSPLQFYRIEGFGTVSPYFGTKPVELQGENEVIFFDKSKKCCGVVEGRTLFLGFDPFMFIYHTITSNLEKKFDERIVVNLVKEAYLDTLSDVLFKAIQFLVVRSDGFIVTKAFWPAGEKFAVCLTHDVDEIRKTYQYLTRTLRYLKQREFSLLRNEFLSLISKLKGDEPYWTFEKIIELEKSLGVTSSFYFLKETGKVKLFDKKTWRHLGRRYDFRDEKVSSIIKRLKREGWDVGLHGSFYSFNNYELLKREKEELESVVEESVRGIRQHNLNLAIPETWRIQERLGFLYDTTLGSNHYLGFRFGTSFPFYPYDTEMGRFLKILEIPIIIEDIVLFRSKDPWKSCLEVIEKVRRCNGVLTLLWHHAVFNDLEFPGWASVYKRIIEYSRKKGAWITNALNLARWWNFRMSASLDVELEDNTILIKSSDFVPINVYCKPTEDLKIPDGIKVLSRNHNSVTIIPTSNKVKLLLNTRCKI